MSMKDKTINIYSWTGKDLYIGPYDDPEVDRVLDSQRCKTCDGTKIDDDYEGDICQACHGTGYSGDFSVEWIDQDNANDPDMNVYEYINY